MSKLKFNVAGLLRLRPFVEESPSQAAEAYGRSAYLSVLIVLGFLLAAAGAIATFGNERQGMAILATACALFVIVAVLEWSHGLRARALNSLFVPLICSVGALVFLR